MKTSSPSSRPLRAALLALALAGCSESTLPPPEHPLGGMWFREAMVQPATTAQFNLMTLEVRDDVVTGSGSWGDVDTPHGSLAVTGTVSGATVTLDITYSSDTPIFVAIPPEHVVAAFDGPYYLTGTLTRSGTSAPVRYDKARPID